MVSSPESGGIYRDSKYSHVVILIAKTVLYVYVKFALNKDDDGELLYLRSHCRLQDLEVARLDSELVMAKAEICRLKGKYWRLELDEQLAAPGRLTPLLV